ncbi:ATP-grasp domain-containing protein [Halomonas sp. Bachu 37]|uniref:ATP-grasp domain-containing protein n=1 Tax=Halomonas kashgarensis TaxID=3084920 RepID=UPI0032164373
MTKKINVLVTGVGGPTPRSFVRSIADSKCDNYNFIGVDANRLAIGLYDTASYSKTYLVPKANDERYWEKIAKIIDRHQIEFAVVLPEAEVVAWSERQDREGLPCKAFISPFKPTAALVDKKSLHDLLKDKSYIPSYCTFLNQTDRKKITVEYPFWVRGTVGSSGLGSLKINNEQELDEWMKINPRIEEFIASEFLPGRNLACKVLYKNGKIFRSACAERLEYVMAKVAPSGITGNTSFGRMINDKGLVDIADDAINSIFSQFKAKANGIFTVDFKENAQGIPMITEINVRFVAFASSLAKAGANLPLDYLEANLNPDNFSLEYQHYEFPRGTIFLRDVDETPLVMNEKDLLAMDDSHA